MNYQLDIRMGRKKSMIIGCNIWMICLESNLFISDLSWMLHLSEFIWTLRSSIWVVFNNFLLIDATDRSKISSKQHRIFFDVTYTPLIFQRILSSVESLLSNLNQYTIEVVQLHLRSSTSSRYSFKFSGVLKDS